MSLPLGWYVDKDHFEKEREKIFAREWLFITPASRLPQVGDYVAMSLMGFQIMVIRQEDGSIRGFHNVCRHRSSILLSDTCGTIKGGCITCPYHNWCYNLSGELRKAPYFNDIEDFHKEDYSLLPIAVRECHGLLFVNLSGEEKGSLQDKEHFDALDKVLGAYPMDGYVYHSMRTFTVKTNWKTFTENYQECYHCRTLHPLFARNYDLDQYKVVNGVGFSHHTCPRKQITLELGSKEGEWIYVYPNLALALYENYYDTLEVIPLSPTETRLIVTFYGRKDLSPEQLARNIEEVSFQTFDEDIASCERVQRGLLSLSSSLPPHWKPAPLHPQREHGVLYFDSLIRASLSP